MTTTELTWTQKQRNMLSERLELMGGLDEALQTRIVSVKVVESQYDAGKIGMAISEQQGRAFWFSSKLLPEDVRDVSGGYGQRMAYALLPVHGGQSGGGGDNVRIIVEPYWGSKTGRFLDIEVGCKHEIKAVKAGNCYHKYNCTKCGFWYEVDSSD